MHAAQIGTQVKTELCGRLRIGGKWFMPGQTVQLDKSDVEIYEARGLSRPARAGAKAANVQEPVVERIHASEVGLVSKETEDFATGGVIASAPAHVFGETVSESTPHVRKSRKGA